MFKKLFIGSALCALTLGMVAQAAPVVSLYGPANVGITTFSYLYNDVTKTITLNETWTASGPGVLIFSGLVPFQNYSIVKNVTNNTGVEWVSIANELLDPTGQNEDGGDPNPQPGFVPAGYSTSNDTDGLSFAQGSAGYPRTSVQFGSLVVDELTDVRDFLDFFGGTVGGAGGTDTMTFGLRENYDTQQPFLLFQRPNERSTTSDVPEPGTLGLFGLALCAAGIIRKRRQQSETQA